MIERRKEVPNLSIINKVETTNHLCARTCDSGCSLTHVLQGPNTQPYIDGCSRKIYDSLLFFKTSLTDILMNTQIVIYMHIYMDKYIHMYINVYTYTYLYIYIHMHIYVKTLIHTNLHIHTYTVRQTYPQTYKHTCTQNTSTHTNNSNTHNTTQNRPGYMCGCQATKT